MSDAPQPGWWQGPDGRWYPPTGAPAGGATATPPPATPPPSPALAPPPVHIHHQVVVAPQKRSRKGAVVALVCCLALPVLFIIGVVALGSTVKTPTTTTRPATTRVVTSNDVSAVVTECNIQGSSGGSAAGTITNTSRQARTYDVAVQFAQPDGSEVLDTVRTTATAGPGGVAQWKASTNLPLPNTTICIPGDIVVTG